MAKMQDQRGSTLLLSLFCLAIVGLMLAGAMTMATGQLKISRLDEDRVRAEYIAEAGARVGLNLVFHDKVYSGSWANQKVQDDSSDNYDLTLAPDSAFNPNNLVITATGHTGGTSRTIVVNVGFKPATKPGLLDLLSSSTASYSHDNANTANPSAAKRWLVTGSEGNRVGNPPDSGFNQVLFNDILDQNGFSIDYYATLTQMTNSATGYGIYYFATGMADNMTAYVLQYDPGAVLNNDGGAFFVKKVIQSPTVPANPSDNETRDYRYAFQDNSSANGTARVSFNDIAKSYIKNFQLNALHKITIKYENGRHKIYIDDVLILDFVDNDRSHPIPKTNAGTGLRVWNARVNFYNAPSTSTGQNVPITATWVRQ